MENLFVCRISDHYIRFMHSRDYRVPFNKGQRRPYVGVVLLVGEFRYFVPMESPKPNHEKMKPGKHYLKLSGGKLGLLGFNNMIPVHDAAIVRYNVEEEPDPKYRALLLNQIAQCNKHKADIMDRAAHTYFSVVNKGNAFLCKISCDFKALEQACAAYDPSRVKSQKQ